MSDRPNPNRRDLLKILGGGSVAAAASTAAAATGSGLWDEYFKDHYREMTREEVDGSITRLEARYKARYGIDTHIKNTPAMEGVLFGYALNISKCKGYRDCVRACQKENNHSRDPEMAYIRVLEMDKGTMDLERSDHYYNPPEVPQDGKFYLPVQCFQCDNPPCVKACPVDATWQEKDGIVVVDYDWCIGCRYCATACPYHARRFNWAEPKIPAEDLNPEMHYLSNRPRPNGVIEKCTFCLQRTREGRQPACQEACPTGARIFGNLLDPTSEIRWVLANKTVFRLKEELNTEPKFWYFTD